MVSPSHTYLLWCHHPTRTCYGVTIPHLSAMVSPSHTCLCRNLIEGFTATTEPITEYSVLPSIPTEPITEYSVLPLNPSQSTLCYPVYPLHRVLCATQYTHFTEYSVLPSIPTEPITEYSVLPSIPTAPTQYTHCPYPVYPLQLCLYCYIP